MLLLFKFLPEKHKTQEENIDCILNRGMILYFTPGPFHFITPVNIIKNKYGCIICFIKKLVEVTHRRLIPVITIYIGQVYNTFFLQHSRQYIVKISLQRLYIIYA